MIFLLNPERVFRECLLGLKSVIAKDLEVPVEWVGVKLERNGDYFTPVVSITAPDFGGMTNAMRFTLEQQSIFFRIPGQEVEQRIDNLVKQAISEIKSGLQGLGL